MIGNKGQAVVGGVIILAITMIVGVILLQASAQQVGDVINTVEMANRSLGTATTNTTTLYLTGYKAISGVVIYNATGEKAVPSNNYTITNNFVNDGSEVVKVQLALSNSQNFTGYGLNISGKAEPTTYDSSSGGRALASLIIIMMALALAVVGVVYVVKNNYY